jgi:hypothetical protein
VSEALARIGESVQALAATFARIGEAAGPLGEAILVLPFLGLGALVLAVMLSALGPYLMFGFAGAGLFVVGIIALGVVVGLIGTVARSVAGPRPDGDR